MPLDASTAITILGVQCWDEGATESFSRDGRGTFAERNILCAWTDRVQLLSLINGGGFLNGSGTYYYLCSLAYPDAPALVFDRADVEQVPINGLSVGPNGMSAAKYARIKIRYKPLLYQEGEQVGCLSVSYGIGSRTIPAVNPGSFTFSNGDPVTSDMLVHFGIASLQFTRYNYAQLPSTLITSLLGCVNSVALFGAAIGTLRFLGSKDTKKILAGGSFNWDVCHQFEFRQYPWNYDLNPHTGTWLEVTPNLYTSADLTPLTT